MALQFTKTDNRGVTATYHRITRITQEFDGEMKGIHVEMAGYVNQGYRDIEKADDKEYTAVIHYPVFLGSTDDSTVTRATAYTRMKAEYSELSKAVDVLEPIAQAPVLRK